MNKCHQNINWVNDTTPAINDTNLNYMDGCIDTIDDRVVAIANDPPANALKAEGYANGTQEGIPVTSGSPYYENNAKYWKEQAQAIASASLSGLSDVSITNPSNGQALVYDATNQEWVNGDSVTSDSIAPTEDGATASKAYKAGETFYRGGKYCECISDISSGGTFTLNTNYKEISVGELNHGWIDITSQCIVSQSVTFVEALQVLDNGTMYFMKGAISPLPTSALVLINFPKAAVVTQRNVDVVTTDGITPQSGASGMIYTTANDRNAGYRTAGASAGNTLWHRFAVTIPHK